ncbi:sugar phosphate nucleotidyltransferase [Rubritalea spongiae]|uniref:Sugar phosphate nucleotidyltransferase n=1 Tax=Rubritalea spongiae TaxID=430797 RepID=A0ABW5DZS5_9BACT
MSDLHKAFILGAGLGTRLRPLTESVPKPLIPFKHEPFAHHVLRHCQSAGIDSFAINTHYQAACWEQSFPNKKFEKSFIELFHEPVLLETGGGIKNIESWIGSDPILVYNGDILTDLDLGALIETHKNSNNTATLALFSEGPMRNVAVEEDKIIDMRHSLGIHPGTHQFTGIYIIEPEILDLIPANEKISIVPAFLELAKQGRLGAHIADGASWQDLGTREEYVSAHFNNINGTPKIHPTAKVAADCHIEDSFIGPDSVIEAGSHLRNTIVWPGARVAANSILSDCVVRESARGTHSHKDL